MLITLIACPNGMGHFQRILKLSLSLKSKNKINLLCSKKQLKKINLKNFNKIKIRPILQEINLKQNPYEKLLKFYNKNFLNYKFFKDSEFIISDNLINKCFYKKKCLLISNFFWSEITKKKTLSRNKYIKIENDFIKKKKIFSNRYFCTKKARRVGSKYNFIEKDNYDLIKTKPKKRNIFIYIGSSEKISKKFYLNIKKLNFIIYSNDKKLIKYGSKKFNFTNKEFIKMKYIFAKAGLSSITDSIKFKVPIVIFRNKKNLEYEHNLRQVLKYKIGSYIENNESFKNLKKKIDHIDKKRYSEFLKNFHKFNFDGSDTIKKFIKSND